ncbi:MAG: uracil-DNA glycosylase [Candidatus Bathyarchaeia archaeon]
MSLATIASEISRCEKCPLHLSRRNAVPGEGPETARILLVGEGPGAEEDQQGRPFVGAAGKLLTEALEEAGIPRETVYITNVVKCRPPSNRTPTTSEREACLPYLKRQIAALKPAVICLLGGTATQTLLGGSTVSTLRGKPTRREGQLYLATYHPASLLYNPQLKNALHEDLRLLRKIRQQPPSEENSSSGMRLDSFV